jgi:hypothetical protein
LIPVFRWDKIYRYCNKPREKSIIRKYGATFIQQLKHNTCVSAKKNSLLDKFRLLAKIPSDTIFKTGI